MRHVPALLESINIRMAATSSHYMEVSKNRGGPPKSSILIGFGTIIFTIHFGGKIPLFWVQHPYVTIPNKNLGNLGRDEKRRAGRSAIATKACGAN